MDKDQTFKMIGLPGIFRGVVEKLKLNILTQGLATCSNPKEINALLSSATGLNVDIEKLGIAEKDLKDTLKDLSDMLNTMTSVSPKASDEVVDDRYFRGAKNDNCFSFENMGQILKQITSVDPSKPISITVRLSDVSEDPILKNLTIYESINYVGAVNALGHCLDLLLDANTSTSASKDKSSSFYDRNKYLVGKLTGEVFRRIFGSEHLANGESKVSTMVHPGCSGVSPFTYGARHPEQDTTIPFNFIYDYFNNEGYYIGISSEHVDCYGLTNFADQGPDLEYVSDTGTEDSQRKEYKAIGPSTHISLVNQPDHASGNGKISSTWDGRLNLILFKQPLALSVRATSPIRPGCLSSEDRTGSEIFMAAHHKSVEAIKDAGYNAIVEDMTQTPFINTITLLRPEELIVGHVAFTFKKKEKTITLDIRTYGELARSLRDRYN